MASDESGLVGSSDRVVCLEVVLGDRVGIWHDSVYRVVAVEIPPLQV